MRVFITGATGYIGSAVARSAEETGHDVVGLAHHDAARQTLVDAGREIVSGGLADTDVLAEAARSADGVVHTASADGEEGPELDEAAVHAMVDALEGSGKPFVYTSGIWVLGETGNQAISEEDPVHPAELVTWRAEVEKWVIAAADRGVRTIVVRPGIVYGRGGGLPAMMTRGDLPLIGDGENRWPVVHIDDVGRLYVAALERGTAGSVLHGVAGHVRAREVAERLGAESVPLDAARERLGAFAEALVLDQRVASEKTRERMEWTPREPGILELSASELGGQA